MRNLRKLGAFALAVVGSLSLSGLGLGALAAPALADDPHDPTMTPEAIARDHAEIQRLNNAQLAYVQRRDAQYAQGWHDYADAGSYAEGRSDSVGGRPYYSREATRSDRRQTSAQQEYAKALADWRADVAACRAGYYERCAQR